MEKEDILKVDQFNRQDMINFITHFKNYIDQLAEGARKDKLTNNNIFEMYDSLMIYIMNCSSYYEKYINSDRQNFQCWFDLEATLIEEADMQTNFMLASVNKAKAKQKIVKQLRKWYTKKKSYIQRTKTKDTEDFLKLYNLKRICKSSFERLGTLSSKSLQRFDSGAGDNSSYYPFINHSKRINSYCIE